ncbi:HNH endonuclease family protein [Actinomadura kijaniata]|uniref:HNH endonuclease family protein n=1 Tax=Actinomadura kijaniata TaxID=46161 RepID=UPI003F1A03DE
MRWADSAGRRAGAAAVALAGVAFLGACDGQQRSTGTAGAPERKPEPKAVAEARRDLSGLRVAAEGSGAGYEREKFGARWKDVDRNGCGQRNDVLARDLRQTQRKGRCDIVSGVLDDPYSGKRIDFTKSRAAEVQIDHVYPLALAWRMGASRWSGDQRERFANDLDNLLAVWGVPNRQKSDKGPGEWKPQQSYQCTYAVRYVAVAHEYGLPVTRADHAALQDFLSRC